MEEKLDNNAFYQNNNIVPNTIDKTTAVLINSIDKSIVLNTDCIMGKNLNNEINNDKLINLDLKINETELNDNDKNSNNKQIINGFTNDLIIMNNGKLKRTDDELSELNSDIHNLNNKIVTKKICNNNTKTITNKQESSNGNTACNSASSSTNNLKEEITNNLDSLSENTETESNTDQFDTEEDLTEDEENCLWDCSVCTYKNSGDALKCLMCDVRKNMSTSTRKPRINPKLLAQQVAKQQQQIQQQALKASSKEKSKIINQERKLTSSQSKFELEPMSPTSSTCSTKSIKKDKKEKPKDENGLIDKKSNKTSFKLKDVNKSNSITKSITVNNVTVMVTEFIMDNTINSNKKSTNLKQK